MLKYNAPAPTSTQRSTKHNLPMLSSSSPMPPMDDIVNAVLPPRYYAEGNVPYTQTVSTAQSTRLDVLALQETLDRKLIHHQVKDLGVCPIRSALYADVFDELMREVTINCPERGLLLLRLRDNSRRTLEAHKVLYDASVDYAGRKAQASEEGRPQMIEQINGLKAECSELESRVAAMHMKCDAVEKKELDRRQADEKRRQDEMGFLSVTNQQLSSHLKTLLEANSKK